MGLYLGRPERAWRSAAMWRTSWLSREVIALPACMAAVAAWGLVHYTGWNPQLLMLRASLAVDVTLLVGAIGALLSFALFLTSGMIYACIRFLQEWATPLTVVNFFLLGSASGFTLATLYASYSAPVLVFFFGGWAIVLTLVCVLTRSLPCCATPASSASRRCRPPSACAIPRCNSVPWA